MAYLVLKNESAIENFSLTDVCQYLDIKREKCHNAFYDAKFTLEVYKKLCERF
jgi:DNA polymerase III epsilon subunit-like protein